MNLDMFRQGWRKCSWEAQLLLVAFGITLLAHTVLFLLIVFYGSAQAG